MVTVADISVKLISIQTHSVLFRRTWTVSTHGDSRNTVTIVLPTARDKRS